MNHPKNQHYVPCCYLKFFSHTGNWSSNRRTKIWYANKDISSKKSVNKLGAKRYAYSRTRPWLDDEIFGEMENDYPLIIEKILSNPNTVAEHEKLQLLLIMFDFNLRNIAYENRTCFESIDVYESLGKCLSNEMFGSSLSENSNDMSLYLNHLRRQWRLKLLNIESEERFLTSDNPATIIFNNNKKAPVGIYLPIHPKYALFGFDKRYILFLSNSLTDEDLGLLNSVQIHRCNRFAYSDHDLTLDKKNWENAVKLFSMPKPEQWVDNSRWKRDFIEYKDRFFQKLSFVKTLEYYNPIRESLKRIIE